MPDEQDSANPFVRFKKEVDNQISQLWQRDTRDMNRASSDTAGRATLTTYVARSSSTNLLDHDDPELDEALTAPDGIAKRLRRETISSWLNYSSYSPANFSNLRQPAPRDLRSDAPRRFTFRNAFEDLLLVHTGQPLKNPDQLSSREGVLQSSSILSLFWDKTHTHTQCDKLEGQRLWEAFFPRSDFDCEAHSIFRKISEAKMYEQYGHRSRLSLSSLVSRAARCEEEVKMDSIVDRVASLGPLGGLGPDGEHIWDAMLELENQHQPWLNKIKPDERERYPAEEPSLWQGLTEEDVYQALHSLFARAWPRSLPSRSDILGPFQSSLANGSPQGYKENSSVTETTTSADGSKSVTKTAHQTIGGTTESTVTKEDFDPSGKVVMCSETTRSFSSNAGNGRPRHECAQQDNDLNGQEAGRKPIGSNGWFWTKGG